MQTVNANEGVASKSDFVDIQDNFLPHADVQPSHTLSAWILIIGSSLGVLAMILVRFLSYSDKIQDWVEAFAIAPLVVAVLWLSFFAIGLVKSVIGRRASMDSVDSFRFDLFVASLKVSVAGTVYCSFWTLLLLLLRFNFEKTLPLMLAQFKLASSHFIFATFFRSKLETCLANIVMGSTYIASGVIFYTYTDEVTFFQSFNLCIGISSALFAILCLISLKWILFISFSLLSSSFFLGAFLQSRYAMAVSFLGAIVLALIELLPTLVEGLASLVAMLFGSWTRFSSSFVSSTSSGMHDPPSTAEAEPLLTARSEQFIVIKN